MQTEEIDHLSPVFYTTLLMKEEVHFFTEIMKTLILVSCVSCMFSNTICYASPDLVVPISAKSIHFSSHKVNCVISFNVDANTKSNFSSISIKYNYGNIEIKNSELDICDFSKLDKVELLQIAGSDTMYLMIVDYIGIKGERRENLYYFDKKKYHKRVAVKANADHQVDYFTKFEGEAETTGYK